MTDENVQGITPPDSGLKANKIFFQDDVMQNVGNILKAIRTREGKTQTEFADFLEMNMQNYSKLERGKYSVSLEKLIEIGDKTNLTLDELTRGVTDDEDLDKQLERVTRRMKDTYHRVQNVAAYMNNASMLHDDGRYEEERQLLDEAFREMFSIGEDKANEKYHAVLLKLFDNQFEREFADLTNLLVVRPKFNK